MDSLLRDPRRWNVFIAFVLLLAVVWTYVSRVPPANAADAAPTFSPREGFAAPDFTLDSLDGKSMTLSDLRAKMVMVNFWASWCPPCRAEMPAMERVYQDYKDKGLVVLAINTTYQDSEADAAQFIQNFGLTFPILLDRTGEVSNRYQLRGLPSTYFIDGQGIIRSAIVGGPMDETLIRSRIEELFKELP